MATHQPFGQARNRNGRDWGNYASLALCPNGSLWAGALTVSLEEGDTAYVPGLGRVYCSSPGTPGALNAVWVPTGGGTNPAVPIYTMPISVSAVGTPAYVRANSGSTTNPTGTQSVSIVPAVANPNLNALRVETTAGEGWIWPLNLSGTPLPAEGYVLEVDISQYPVSTFYGAIMPLGRIYPSGGGYQRVNGIMQRSWNGATNIELYDLQDSGSYSYKTQFVPFPSPPGWPSSPTPVLASTGPFTVRYVVRKLDNQTPAIWSFRYDVRSNGTVNSGSVSGVATPRTAVDGQPFTDIGIGVIDGPGAFDIQGLRIYQLP